MKNWLFSLLLLPACSYAQNDVGIIRSYLESNARQWNLSAQDVHDLQVVSTMSSNAENVRHLVVQQFIGNLPVSNARATVTLKNNAVVRVSKGLIHLPSGTEVETTMQPAEAVQIAFRMLGLSGQPEYLKRDETKQLFLLSGAGVSRTDIPARKMYFMDETGLRVIWDMSIYPINTQHWWSLKMDAVTGEILVQNDWITHCDFEEDVCTESIMESSIPTPLSPPPPPGVDQYRVYGLPNISPAHGDRVLLINPSDPTYSPFGWHDTNGSMGDEYTITRGNNVYASEDINDDDIPGYSPDGGATLNFDFAYDSVQGVQGNLDAVITNLFYMNNMMHDIWAYYGFDEVSGNFQSMNYSGNGLGDDFVFADAQDGSGTNNANFGTPPDGENPRMQMYLWTSNSEPDLLTINSPASISGSYGSSIASFGPPVPSTPITEDLVLVVDGGTDPNDACETITNGAALNGKIAVVKRGSCTFAAKVENIQTYGALAVIVINNTGGAPITMGGSSSTANIPAIMISQADGNTILAEMTNGTVNGTIVNPGDLTATDSDFDNMVIAHEYGHGISNRLIGGPDNTDCMYNEEQMGEGWSDWFGLMVTQKASDQPGDPRGVGTYVTNQPNNGTGIRPAPYSTDFQLNAYTYGNTNSPSLSMPHGVGFVWATMLWDLNWALIDQYGFDPDVKQGTGGNNMAMALIIEGLKLTPCQPGFVDGRDAILAADQTLYGGANACLIWEAFAKRGLGYSADQGSSDSRSDQTEAFDLPPSCMGSSAGIDEWTADAFFVYPNPASQQLSVHFKSYEDVSAIRITDLTGKVVLEHGALQQQEISFDISTFKAGMYLVQIETGKGLKVVQFIKR